MTDTSELLRRARGGDRQARRQETLLDDAPPLLTGDGPMRATLGHEQRLIDQRLRMVFKRDNIIPHVAE